MLSHPGMFSLEHKVTVVTGAGSGIGAAIAETFAGAGALVYVADRDSAQGQQTVSRIEKKTGKAKLAVVDITNEQQCQSLIKKVLSENSGRCDVLVNNAGIGHVRSEEHTSELQSRLHLVCR